MRSPAFLALCLSLGFVFALDIALIGLHVHSEGPVTSILYPLHLLLFAIGGLALVILVNQASDPSIPPPQSSLGPGRQRQINWVLIGLGYLVSGIFAVSPALFTRLALEDGVIETIAAAGYFTSVGLLIACLVALRRYRGPHRGLWRLVLAGGALVLFVMGGEEISWGQRIFNIATPALFAGNHQQEINLHNYASNLTETFIDSLAVFWLVLLPFAGPRLPLLRRWQAMQIFMPAPYLLIVGTLTTIYYHRYWLWYSEPLQFYFFIALAVSVLAYVSRRPAPERAFLSRPMALALIVLMLASQVLFITGHGRFGRDWDLTEYRELFIPLGYLLYTAEVFLRMRGLSRAAPQEQAA